ncbi:MAG: hypothetical protein BZY83_05740, partial [SAR202 cluster bacterium Casp-Chloro-G2]
MDHANRRSVNCDTNRGDGPVRDSNGTLVTRMAMVPVAQGAIEQTWLMRGTGSKGGGRGFSRAH